MPQNHRLQFSVEESICFQKGQEVSELLSISLDPDIRVQEVNDYVSIRGSLELTGEYNIDQSRDFEELITEKRFVEEVRTREDGTAELTHCFPVDITIPKNKVSHLNDVFVFIDAFDYQLSESRLLTIQADLAIEGLLDENEIRQPEAPLYAAPEFLQGKDEDNHTSESPSLNNREPETDENQAEDSAPPAPEAVLRQESEEAEENAAEDLASLAPEAGLHLESEEAASPVSEAELRQEPEEKAKMSAAEEAAPPVPEAELRQEAEAEKQAGEITASPPETALRQETEETAKMSAAEEAAPPVPEVELRQEAEAEKQAGEITASPPETALRQEPEETAKMSAAEEAAPPVPEAELRQEAEAEKQAGEITASPPETVLRQETEETAKMSAAEEASPPVPEAELRQEAEAEKQAGEITAAPPETALRQEPEETAEMSAAEEVSPSVPEAKLRQEPEEKAEEKAAEVYSSPLPETVLRQEAEEEASVAKISAPPLPEAALRQESKEEAEAAAPPASEPVLHQEEKKEFEPLLRVGTKKRSEEKTDSECEPSLHAEQEPSDEAGENSFAENQSLTEEPEADLTPAYRAFLPEHEPEEHSLYSAPKLLEEKEEEREEAGFEIEVRKTSSAEKADEEFHPEFSFQLSHTPESGSKEPAAHTKRAPTAETEEPQARENNNSLYLTKLFTREEEEFSRMKICIVQQQDTIDRVCERYDISSQQLIRMNALSLDAELEEGQILYIPEYNNSHA
ncbi:LysM peptidoglycan-binding domain-containing protein [Bacillus atrophaeus]|uniref:LysM peptidoglycan-binding domain-containing protein n=1 Tax=Bacillus atrophaeus TaxID=1452 RepID=UPI0028F6F97C|nr:LysM peptidoglycan-binding domain-containing protein [Bacillus atrophaeus]WNV78616.1 LysM peptidoglycan-binding domain-containing protein [Bacillus atrophaeus]